MQFDKDLQLIYITEVTKKDIMAGLDLMALPMIWLSYWNLDDISYEIKRKQQPRPPQVYDFTVDQVVRILYMTEEIAPIIGDLPYKDVDTSEPYSGIPETILYNLRDYLLQHDDDVATFTDHTMNYFVVGLDKEKTQNETDNVWAQTVEDLDNLLKNLH